MKIFTDLANLCPPDKLRVTLILPPVKQILHIHGNAVIKRMVVIIKRPSEFMECEGRAIDPFIYGTALGET